MTTATLLEPTMELGEPWQRSGNYYWLPDTTQQVLYASKENKQTGDVDRIRVMLEKFEVRMRYVRQADDVSGDSDVVFKRYKHQGKWRWSDSRQKGAVTRDHVLAEVQRMLRMTRGEANEFVNTWL